MIPAALAALVAAAPSGAGAHSRDAPRADAAPEVLAPGWTPLAFEPPEPGTYELPPLGTAADGDVLTTEGDAVSLHELYDGRVALLSFVYATCPDVNGCPLATAVLAKLQRRLGADPELRERVVLLSLSINPTHDSPSVMGDYGRDLADGPGEWHFLTTRSEAALAPILDAYDQSISKDYDETGSFLGTISHVLRVALIDETRRIRNVYNVSFLHADTVLTDIRTLLAAQRRPTRLASATGDAHASLQGPGDDKTGYEQASYETRSRDLRQRRGEPADLLTLARTPPLGLPPLPVPADNSLTATKIALGRKLFFDRRLSLNATFSCAMCHIPEQGFTSNELQTAVGIEGRTVRRNAPTIYNVGYLTRLFHDAREHSLEQQIWGPLLARNEMGNPSVGHVVETLHRLPDYAGRFEAAFDGRSADMLTIGQALASYQRTLVAADSPFDRWRYGGDSEALGAEAERGFALFSGKARCAGCHVIGDEHALFTDDALHDTGIGYRASMTPEPASRTVQVAPGVTLDIETASYAAAAETPPSDLGRYEITQDPADRWQYRTPTLRNVALTAPYMHDGSLPTLRSVVEYYGRGGVPHDLLDPRIRPLDLEPNEIDALVAFLESLTGATVETLVADAFAAPVGDATHPPTAADAD